jgi:hypothetical protein
MTLDNERFCKNVVTIPQYIGTCWFNAILMALFYSQNSRKLLLHDNIYEKDKGNNELYKILNDILLDNYISQKKAMKYYEKLRPEIIIEKNLTKIIDKPKFDYIVAKGWIIDVFLPRFIEIIGKTCLTLDEYNGEFYINAVKAINLDVILQADNTTQTYASLNTNYKKILNEMQAINKKEIENPDYLFVNFNKKNNVYGLYDPFFKLLEKKIKNLDKINVKKYKKPFKGLENLEKTIEFNGDTYILDSCLLTNYNKYERGNHAICGLSCKNNKYVYNGWMRTTNDPSLVADKNLFKQNNLPCELMKFDWDVNNPNSKFCLNHARCNLRSISKSTNKELCFSFGKGIRTVVYVKTKKEFKSMEIKENVLISKPRKVGKIGNTCPKPRRPVDGKCEEAKEIRSNKQGFLCCYKTKKDPSLRNTCPKPRRPIDGKCLNGLNLKMNKQNFECCYKK